MKMDHDVGSRDDAGRDRPASDDAPTQAWSPEPGSSGREATEGRARARTGVTEQTPARTQRIAPAKDTGEGKRPSMQVRRLRRGRLAIRKIDPWAVLKFSLVFYFCMLLIFLLGTAVIFATLRAFGVIGNIEEVLRRLQIEFVIAGGTIFRWLFLVGLAWTVVASAITVFLSFLYNLIADVVGGIELLVTERE